MLLGEGVFRERPEQCTLMPPSSPASPHAAPRGPALHQPASACAPCTLAPKAPPRSRRDNPGGHVAGWRPAGRRSSPRLCRTPDLGGVWWRRYFAPLTRALVHPLLARQVQSAIHQRRTFLRSISQKHPDLGVLDAPAVPVYWRAIPTDFSLFFREPVSSTMSTPLSPPRCSMTYSRRSSRTASHRAALRRRCAPWGPIYQG